MCRNIRPLFNFDPPASEAEIRASALQFVQARCSGFSPALESQRGQPSSARSNEVISRRRAG